LSYIKLSYNLKTVDRFLKIDAYAVFDKTKSWTKTSSPKTLRHEQGHFDITEIYALQWEKEMNETKYKDARSFMDSLRTTYERIQMECNKKNEDYDLVGGNELLVQQYYKWIREQLDLYKEYQ
ncbi:MAG TPA: hypothetical protein VLD19_16230, partial [Chitinophagaceae bacterium]|nr:hypothetical protein [Chitinophagaceae bacterium]